MKELKESQIKLFGREIVLPENGGEDSSGKFNGDESDLCEVVSDGGKEEAEGVKQLPDDKGHIAEQTGKKPKKEDQNLDESRDLDYPSGPDENSTTPPIDEVAVSKNKTEPESKQTDPAKNGTLKALKKPDKILPCPRCNSMDTKFCYYNNYSVNQPRHFCKSCQRCWAAGGTMRNVPVGAGRRKNKSSNSHCRHITIPEALQPARVDPPGFNPNSTVLSFGPGPDSPLCESMASGLNLTDKRAQNRATNGLHKTTDDGRNPGLDGMVNVPRQPIIHNMNGLPIPCVPGIPWNIPVPLPAICPVPFYPAPYWNYNLTSAWSCPWLTAQSPTANRNATGGSDPGSPLGKHSRNGELLKACGGSENKDQTESKNSERSIVVPKTLRIDDPKEAAKSSIWETLGIKYDSSSREGLFKALQPKCSEGKIQVSASTVLQANPAALSRSISFQEGA